MPGIALKRWIKVETQPCRASCSPWGGRWTHSNYNTGWFWRVTHRGIENPQKYLTQPGAVRCHLSSNQRMKKTGEQWCKHKWEEGIWKHTQHAPQIVMWVKVNIDYYIIPLSQLFWWASVSYTVFLCFLILAMLNIVVFLNSDLISPYILSNHDFNEIHQFWFFLCINCIVFLNVVTVFWPVLFPLNHHTVFPRK